MTSQDRKFFGYKNALKLAFVLVPIFAIFCGVFSNTFVFAGSGGLLNWVWLPWHHRSSTVPSVLDLRQLKEKKDQNVTLIFIVDCSASTEDDLAATPPLWLDDVLTILEQETYPIKNLSKAINSTEQPNSQQILEAALFYLLREAGDLYGNSPGHSFSTWQVCSDASRTAPDLGTELAVTRENIDKAVQKIDRTDSGDATWTDLLGIFNRVIDTYKLDRKKFFGPDRPVRYIVTVISDFEDSVSEDVSKDQRKVQLRKAMDRIMEGQTQVNLVTVGQGTDSSVITYFEQNTEWYRFSRFDLNELLPTRGWSGLLPIIPSDKELSFFYRSRAEVNTSADIRLDQSSDVDLVIPESKGADSLDFAYGYRLLSRAGEPVETSEEGIIRAGKRSASLQVRKNDILNLSFHGPAPTSQTLLRIAVKSDRRAYLIPLRFRPRLPTDVSWLMILLQVVVVLGFMVAFVTQIWSKITRVDLS